MTIRIEIKDGNFLLNGSNIEFRFVSLSGEAYKASYGSVEQINPSSYRGIVTVNLENTTIRLEDIWSYNSSSILLRRELKIGSNHSGSTVGISVSSIHLLGQGRWRFFIPAACYDYCPVEGDKGYVVLSEERMTYPLVLAYREDGLEGIVFFKTEPARLSKRVLREKAQNHFVHFTEIGGLGFRRSNSDIGAAFICAMPYREEPHSRMMNSALTPFFAYLPPMGESSIVTTYEISAITAESFDLACLKAYELAHTRHRPSIATIVDDVSECVRVRTECMANLVETWNGYTALNLNFDPRIGVGSAPSGYGTWFNKLNSDIYPDILEYGFTGRQINNAYMLNRLGRLWNRPQWLEIASKIVQSYLRHCTTTTGFLYTLYDTKRGKAFNPLGDPIGCLLHYGQAKTEDGNYLRNMAEAAFDLCKFLNLENNAEALNASRVFGDFLLRTQNKDGSWYRAFTVDGKPITRPEEWFGGTERAVRSSTSTAVMPLIELYKITRDRRYLRAAEHAADWILQEVVSPIDYRGGTLDNPNVVDKESMAYVMKCLLGLYEITANENYVKGAIRAGGMALTWNFLWDVPFEPGSRMSRYDFKSRGWGGINILWGAGVVDIYSLWFIRDWLSLSNFAGRTVFKDVANLALHGAQQMLSMPNCSCDLVSVGMQEEGFACSHQGVDEALIEKGNTWGSLGWVFGAGTYGVWEVLESRGFDAKTMK